MPSRLHRMTKQDAERTLRQLEEETRELRKEAEEARRMVKLSPLSINAELEYFTHPLSLSLLTPPLQSEDTVSSADLELSREEQFLGDTISAASTLHQMVKEKEAEANLMRGERDDVLRAVAQVSRWSMMNTSDQSAFSLPFVRSDLSPWVQVKRRLEDTSAGVMQEEEERDKELRGLLCQVDTLR
jgi:hypothetical protein